MVIVVMDDNESIGERVGAGLAQSLGWDFLDFKKQFQACERGPGIGGHTGDGLCFGASRSNGTDHKVLRHTSEL